MPSVLIVDKDVERRAALRDGCVAKGAICEEAEDAFSAMNALGKSDFSGLIAHAGKRHLSLRGLMQLAKRKNRNVTLIVLADEEDEAAVRRAMGADVLVVVTTTPVEEIADHVATVPEIQAPAAPPPSEKPKPTPQEPPATEIVAEADVVDTTTASVDEGAAEDAASANAGVRAEASGAEASGAEASGAEASRAEASRSENGGAPGFEKVPGAGAFDAGTGGSSVPATAVAEEPAAIRVGAEVLMDAFARELTGAVRVVDEESRWTLYFYGGEPAWALPPRGDEAVFERLVATRALPPDSKPEPVADGELLASLVAAGQLEQDKATSTMRGIVTECTLALARASAPEIETTEVSGYLSSVPPFRINPFGMLLEARRSSMTPDELLAEASELESAHLVARPALSHVGGKIAPFVRGADLDAVLAERPTIEGFREAAGLDLMMGTLLAFSLVDAGLARIDSGANGTPMAAAANGASAPSDEVATEEADAPAAVEVSPDEAGHPIDADSSGGDGATEACELIEAAVLPNEILGVDVDAELDEVEASHERLSNALDAAAAGDAALRSRAEKARTKLERAVRTMRATAI